MPVDPRTPCIIGVAQRTWRPVNPDPVDAPEPLDMWEEVAVAAGDDASIPGLATDVDSLQIVYCQTWPYDDPVARLSERIGAAPRHRYYSGIGGTTPQVLVNETAESILKGDYNLALITGAEALDTMRRAKKQGRRLPWSHRNPEKAPFPFEAPFHPAEVAHEVFQAWLTFPVFDIARRAHLGCLPEGYRERLGQLLEPMTKIAAANPYAWFPLERSADELITPTKSNRLVGYPYTKYMVSVMDVDMAAALIVASHEKADALGVPADKRVYLRGWAYGNDPWYIAERPELWRSEAMKQVSQAALTMAGAVVDDVAHLDLYSCFASSVLFARDALGFKDSVYDRPITVTGGLPFSGGAGSDYMTHSIAAMAGTLRNDPGSLGMVSGVGMHMTKHTYAVYGTEPPAQPLQPVDGAALQARLDALPKKAIADSYAGRATVATYTVAHGRSGEAEWGLAVCDVDAGTRCYAKILDADLLAQAEATELVGTTVTLVPGDNNANVVKELFT
ncbi:MAG TPA: acetyl-CoA acetyltransferase [Acidimicrobiales bacterium]|nr:acetyl-CoA acetyltransferase [Acidimicrobiales bacterium]